MGWELAKLHLLGRILGTRVSDGVNGLVDARRFRPMGTGPLVDRGIVGSCVGKGLRRQPTAFLQGESLAVLDARGHQGIVRRIGDNSDRGAVFRSQMCIRDRANTVAVVLILFSGLTVDMWHRSPNVAE